MNQESILDPTAKYLGPDKIIHSPEAELEDDYDLIDTWNLKINSPNTKQRWLTLKQYVKSFKKNSPIFFWIDLHIPGFGDYELKSKVLEKISPLIAYNEEQHLPFPEMSVVLRIFYDTKINDNFVFVSFFFSKEENKTYIQLLRNYDNTDPETKIKNKKFFGNVVNFYTRLILAILGKGSNKPLLAYKLSSFSTQTTKYIKDVDLDLIRKYILIEKQKQDRENNKHNKTITMRAEFSHQFEVSGHWRLCKHGKDPMGNYTEGKTWVRNHIKGPEDKPLIKKDRIIIN